MDGWVEEWIDGWQNMVGKGMKRQRARETGRWVGRRCLLANQKAAKFFGPALADYA